MKNIITLLFLSLVISLNTLAQEQFWKDFKNDRERLGITDSSTTMFQSHHNISRFKGKETIYKRSNYRGYNINYWFNQDGNIEREISINEDSSVYSITSFLYNGSKLKETVMTYDSISFYKTKYEYNSLDQLIKEIEFKEDGDTSRIVYKKYNNEGQLIELLSDDLGRGQLYYRFSYKYYTKKNLIESTYYNSDNKATDTRNYLLDNNNNLSKMVTIRDKYKRTINYYYNEKNEIIKQVSVSKHSNQEFKDEINYEYEYNESGQWTKKIEFYKNSVDGQIWMRELK